jgi:hypothetical protein
MGYTHYWRNTKAFAPEFVLGVRQILAFTTVPLLREYDEPGTKPEVTNERIIFNGAGNDGHETFWFAPGQDFAFCKTQEKPYDVVVVAILTLANHMGIAYVSSDGDEEDWKAGVELCRLATGISDIENPMRGT